MDLPTESQVGKKRPAHEELERRPDMQKLSRLMDGTWIECCNKNCNKWRLTYDYEDPTDVPDMWFCDMNSDTNFASCDVPQEIIPNEICEKSLLFKYQIGSIVWARIRGFPWWPAMVDDCPESFVWYQLQGSSTVPTKYHVVFFDSDKPKRAWMRDPDLKVYKKNPREILVKRTKYKTVDYKTRLDEACNLANAAAPLTISQRLEEFGWAAREARKNRARKKSETKKSRTRTSSFVAKKNVRIRKEKVNRQIENETFEIGDVVWARSTIFRGSQNRIQAAESLWWPAMIDACKILKKHQRVPESQKEPTMYHVVYFNAEKIENDWLSEVKSFVRIRKCQWMKKTKIENKDYKRSMEKAHGLATEAQTISLELRLSRFGLVERLSEELNNSIGSRELTLDGSSETFEDENERQNNRVEKLIEESERILSQPHTYDDDVSFDDYSSEESDKYCPYQPIHNISSSFFRPFPQQSEA